MENEIIKEHQWSQTINLTTKQKERAGEDNSFALKLFRIVSKEQTNNVFISPMSLNMVLGMLYNGASGDTREDIAEALGIAGFSETEVNEYYQKISQALMAADPTTDIIIANSIWVRNDYPIKNHFIKIGKQYFDVEVRELYFNNQKAVNAINNWCSKKTNKKIKNIISGTIPDDMMMYLINALYFKSKWQEDIEFDKKKTKLDNFTTIDSQKIKVNMMEQTSYLNYFADEFLQCVEMDYGNQAFSMIAVLPSPNTNIDLFIDYLDNEKLQNAVNKMRVQEVRLKFPRFKIEGTFSLSKALTLLGMKQMFCGGFTNISDDDLWVSKVIQKTFMEVNEEGTEAAAVTTIVETSGFPEKVKPVRFFANRPFLFMIREKRTGIILFIGRMDEPYE